MFVPRSSYPQSEIGKIVDALDVVGRVRLVPDVAGAALEDLGRQLRERGGGRRR
jgi:hypothetical protein